MPPALDATIARIASLRAGRGLRGGDLEEALTGGYADALAADGWLARSERLVQAILDGPTSPRQDRRLRELATRRAAVERSLVQLRGELTALRERSECLRGSPPPDAPEDESAGQATTDSQDRRL